jgi:pimeloyl-ACP methyl ester carboxylesterase
MLLLIGLAACLLPTIGAALILHPVKRHVLSTPPSECYEVTLQGEGVNLRGWRGQAVGDRRGTVIYLHGLADNRTSGAGVMERFRRLGFDVVAYDSRAHGESDGDACTYGYHEKEDLRRIIDILDSGPIILIGGSLGAAVGLQAAAVDRRISAVIAAETFSDLRTVVIERAPIFFTRNSVNKAIKLAEQKGSFYMNAVSPVLAARTITAPVLLIHGASDSATPPEHSRRVFESLSGTKRLILVPGAEHNESLKGSIWNDIVLWVDTITT